ncbi:MAG: hypothetical protein C4519_16455 [Desulfobacteraceae bacterium]|nr:MAG: hypothetical protein C4519_16455 [Desulfobacteraceae bacterium]
MNGEAGYGSRLPFFALSIAATNHPFYSISTFCVAQTSSSDLQRDRIHLARERTRIEIFQELIMLELCVSFQCLLFGRLNDPPTQDVGLEGN